MISLGTFLCGNGTTTMEYVEYQFEVAMLDSVSERYCAWELVLPTCWESCQRGTYVWIVYVPENVLVRTFLCGACLWWVRAHTRAIHVIWAWIVHSEVNLLCSLFDSINNQLVTFILPSYLPCILSTFDSFGSSLGVYLYHPMLLLWAHPLVLPWDYATFMFIIMHLRWRASPTRGHIIQGCISRLWAQMDCFL